MKKQYCNMCKNKNEIEYSREGINICGFCISEFEDDGWKVIKKKKCVCCKEKKKITDFAKGEYPSFRDETSCKVCCERRRIERVRYNKDWTENQEKLRREFVVGGGIIKSPIVGCTAKYIDDKLVIINRGHLASERLI